jgi:hypothetical protein
MAFRIFDVDNNETKAASSDDIVGRFRSGHQLNGRPMALSAWRVTGADPVTLEAISDMMGGSEDKPDRWDTKSDETYEVFTNSTSVDIILDGPNALKTGMVLWGRKTRIRECDGVSQTDEAASDCACPSDIRERKEAAKNGTACEPSIQIYFRMAANPELGKLKFFTGSWSMAKEIGAAEDKLAKIGGPATATLSLEVVSFTTKDGKEITFTKPILEVHDAVDADAEPF